MARYTKKSRIDVAWGNGESSLFLLPDGKGQFSVLDYEFDTEEVHRHGGGRCYYISGTGSSGAGYLNNYGDLIPCGTYRIDTGRYQFHASKIFKGMEDVKVLIPYVSHGGFNENEPIVLVRGWNIYFSQLENLAENIMAIRKEPIKPTQSGKDIIERTFVDEEGDKCKIYIKFKNSYGCTRFRPWDFADEIIEDFKVNYSERIYDIFGLYITDAGVLVRAWHRGSKAYAIETISKDDHLFEEMIKSPFKEWECIAKNTLIKYNDDDSSVEIVTWEVAESILDKKFKRCKSAIPAEMWEKFDAFFKANAPKCKYFEYEVSVSKWDYAIDPKKCMGSAKKGLALKVSKEISNLVHQFKSMCTNSKLLEELSNDIVVTFNDSIEAGNCEPGTRQFAEKFFPGQNETTVGELKKHSNNWNVMRLLRNIAKKHNVRLIDEE